MSNIFPNSMAKLRDHTTEDSVDVIMRTKDRPALLGRALASVVHQQHARWHIYLINDGGQAAPVDAMVDTFADRLAGRITVIHNPESLGMSAAANLGLTRGRSAFVATHDDDDSWDPAFLSTGTAFLLAAENRRFGATLCRWNRVEESFDGARVDILGGRIEGYDGDVVDFLDVLRTPQIPPIALLWRRSISKAAGFLNEHLPVLDDWDLNLRALQLADIALLPEALANYHVRVSADAGDYANTITEGLSTHVRYNILYRNSLLRAYLDHDPSQIGLVAGLLKNAEVVRQSIERLQIASHRELSGNQHHIDARLDRIEADVRDSKAMLEKILGAINRAA
jgi:glycosyltransferase involved in cell wall biosynthesis